jgi:hypothetical protein
MTPEDESTAAPGSDPHKGMELRNQLRRVLQKRFQGVSIHTLPYPAEPDVIQRLESLPFADVSQAFEAGVKRAVTQIVGELSVGPLPQVLGGRVPSGAQLVSLIAGMIRTINEGAAR